MRGEFLISAEIKIFSPAVIFAAFCVRFEKAVDFEGNLRTCSAGINAQFAETECVHGRQNKHWQKPKGDNNLQRHHSCPLRGRRPLRTQPAGLRYGRSR